MKGWEAFSGKAAWLQRLSSEAAPTMLSCPPECPWAVLPMFQCVSPASVVTVSGKLLKPLGYHSRCAV